MAKPNGLTDDELELDPDLESITDPPEEDPVDEVEEDVEEDVEEVDPVVQFQEPSEDRIPKSRYDAEKARADTLQHVLDNLRQYQQPAAQPAPQAAVVEDAEANLTPEDRKWREYIRQAARPEIERRVKEVVEQIQSTAISPLQRTSIEVQERIAENDMRRQFKDWDTVRDAVNKTRAEWFQRYNVVAPPDVAYHYVKGQQATKTAQTTRTSAVRANAKQTATVSNKPPTKKVSPKGPITLNDVANMSLEDTERWLMKTGSKF